MKQGSLVVVPFPFTDLSAVKQRPCLVLSGNNFNKNHEDLIVAAITSQTQNTDNGTVSIFEKDLQEGSLPKNSFIKCHKVFTVHKDLIRKTVGILDTTKMVEVKKNFDHMWK